MILVPDVYKQEDEILRTIKYATFDKKGNVRLDRIDLKSDKGNRILERMTHFGKMLGSLFSIDDFTFSKTDIKTNVIESAEMSVTNGVFGTSHIPYPNNFKGIDGKTKDFGFINRAIYDLNELEGYNYRISDLSDNVTLPWLANEFEDTLNIEYSGLIGNLSAIITQASMSIPFRVDIVIDSKYGFNITNLKEIFKDSEFKDIIKKEIESLGRAISVINRKLKEICEKEKRYIRIYSGIREFDSYINIQDVDNKIKYTLHLNNSDHARSLFTTISHLGRRWYDTEEFGDLMETKCTTIPAAMYEMGDENRRYTFENADYSDNFLLSYN